MLQFTVRIVVSSVREGISRSALIPRSFTASMFHTSSPVRDHQQRQDVVALTRQRYSVVRGGYNRVEADDLDRFRAMLDPARVLTDTDDLVPYNTDWWRSCRGESSVVLKPRTTDEVSAILSHCHARRLAVCPQAGNTAVVGNGVPVFDELIISTELMNRIEHFDELTGTLQCQSGCVLEKLQQHLAERGHLAPLDLGAKGSCQIGGNLATNAGGLQVFRYGSLRSNVLGIEVVLANGQVLDLMSSMMKDNTGYDLKHLFIGSEGTLGIITRVCLRCPILPSSVNLAFLGVDSFDHVLKIYSQARAEMSEILSSCELIDKESVICAQENLSVSSPLSSSCPFYVMLETSGGNSEHDQQKLTSFLERVMDKQLVIDGTLASNTRETQAMWALREGLPDALMRDGHAWLYDVSLPIQRFYQCVEQMRQHLLPFGSRVRRVCGFGHLGDGNVHVNVTASSYDAEVERVAEQELFSWTASQDGSISAEHGIGFKKRDLLHLAKSEAAIALMRQIKQTLDPASILNPYKVLPDTPGNSTSN